MHEMKTLTLNGETFDSFVDQTARQKADEAVRTVNGKNPDENGNIEIKVNAADAAEVAALVARAETAATDAEADAKSARTAATEANNAKGSAMQSASTASAKAILAQTHAGTATEKATAAEESATNASASATRAETAATSADAAATRATEAAERAENASSNSGGNVDLTGYATEQFVREYAQPKGEYLTEVPDAYATKEFVTNKIAEAELGGEEVDLSGYAQKSELPTKVSQLTNDSGFITKAPVDSVNGKTGSVNLTASDVKARPDTWMPTAQEVGALPSTYTPPNQTAAQVGADPAGTAESKVSDHNVDAESHNDLRLELKALSDRLTAFFDSDDTTLDELSEIVAYITNNKTLIESITTSKVSVADIVNNLTTNVANKPLSAAQGVVLKGLIDSLNTSLSGYQPKGDYALNSAIPTKVSQLQNDSGYLTEHQDISGLAAKFDPTVYGLPVLYLTGDISPIAVSKDNKVTLTYVYGDRSGTCTLKGQGATSYKNAQALVNAGKAGKFNYTINFDTAFEAKSGWGVQKKYCLKANFIDHSHSRNVVSARLWGLIVKSRTTANANLSGLVNGGAVDGFPIVIMLNGEFHGLYTFNIPKDGWMMGMVEDTTKTQALVGANDHELATQFKGELAGDESDFELEFVSDEDNADWVTTSLNTLINACINTTGSDLDTTVAQYLDWDSAIDYYIWVVVCKGTDMVDKNYLLSTFDGTKWHFTAYDMDSTYGLEWDGSELHRAVSNVNFEECAETHRVYELIKRFKTNALKARYNELRKNVLSETRICQYFENFAWAIPSPVALEDVKLYPTVMGSSVNGIDQICRWVRQRLEATDAWANALPAQETPVEPEQPVEVVNLVPTSADTDGSVYNGTGYKDNARLSSSGGVSGTAQAGSVVTGFIPFKNTDVVRMKGAEWLDATTNYSGHYYINLYDSSKNFISKGGVSSSAYGTYSTQLSAVYDEATGVTAFSIIDPSSGTGDFRLAARSAAYFRINAYGNGADLIITVNQEITE